MYKYFKHITTWDASHISVTDDVIHSNKANKIWVRYFIELDEIHKNEKKSKSFMQWLLKLRTEVGSDLDKFKN